MPFDKMLVAIDFSSTSDRVLDYAIAMARRFRAELKLLHVVEPSRLFAIAFPEEALESEKAEHAKSMKELDEMLASIDTDNIEIETFVAEGKHEKQILSAIHENGVNLLIIGNHRRSFVLDQVSIPALTVAADSKPPAFDRILLATDLSDSSLEGFVDVARFAKKSHAHVA